MTPEARHSLARARLDLEEARIIAALPLARVAARSAYSATFHAAEAFIFERSGRIAKTHSGVRSEFSRLMKGSAAEGRDLSRILIQGYRYKELADYGVDLAIVISDQAAADMIDAAAHFVERVTEILSGSSEGHV